ncbi:MAG: 50S ribosomal protein L21 [Nitrospinota bacterium]
MFAVIRSGAKQYKVKEGSIIKVEKLEGDVGSDVNLETLLLATSDSEIELNSDKLGNQQVKATIISQTRGEKVIILKHKRRKNYKKKTGHRQSLTELKILSLQ